MNHFARNNRSFLPPHWNFKEFTVRLPFLSIFLVFLFLPAMGCGEPSTSQVESNDIQAYIDSNPELAARQKERQVPDTAIAD